MERYKFISEYKGFRAEHLFYIDVDMRFVGEVGVEILPKGKDLVGHPSPRFLEAWLGKQKDTPCFCGLRASEQVVWICLWSI